LDQLTAILSFFKCLKLSRCQHEKYVYKSDFLHYFPSCQQCFLIQLWNDNTTLLGHSTIFFMG